jgi:hypothetical protein
MTVGSPAYTVPNNNKKQLMKKIQHEAVKYPPKLQASEYQATRDLIDALTVKDPARRLGSMGGAGAIKQHLFFEGVDFGRVLAGEYPAEFVPPPRGHDEDTSNFNQRFTDMEAGDSFYENPGDFKGFEFELTTESLAAAGVTSIRECGDEDEDKDGEEGLLRPSDVRKPNLMSRATSRARAISRGLSEMGF